MVESLAWPGVVAILGVIFIFAFRPQIGALINRIYNIGGKSGISALPDQQHQLEAAKEIKESPSEELMRVFDSSLLLQQEEAIKKELEAKGVDNDEEKVKILTRYLAAFTNHLDFERTYRLIFGSQISLLQYLNSLHNIGSTAEELMIFYNPARYGYEGYPFSKYMEFLENSGLAVREVGKAEDKAERFFITQKGRDFLEYIVRQGYSFSLPR